LKWLLVWVEILVLNVYFEYRLMLRLRLRLRLSLCLYYAVRCDGRNILMLVIFLLVLFWWLLMGYFDESTEMLEIVLDVSVSSWIDLN